MHTQRMYYATGKYRLSNPILAFLALGLGAIVVLVLGLRVAQAGPLAPPEPYLVRDINTYGLGSGPSHLTDVNGTLFFRARDGSSGH